MTRRAQEKGIIAPMSRRIHRRLSASLCLVAMLLLSALPTLGRLAGHHEVDLLAAARPVAALASTSHMSDTSHAMHASRMEQVPHHGDAPQHGAPSTEGHVGHECPYCPLLAGLVSIEVPPKVPAALPACRPVVPDVVGSRTVSPQTSCLGSRGPPVLLIG
jgi:hypothetical protein